MLKAFKLLLLPFFLSFTLKGQILNIEKFRVDKDTFNVWAGNVGLGYSAKKQQTSITTLNANSNLAYLSKKHCYLNINNIKFVHVQGGKPVSDGYTHWRITLNRKKFISYEPFLQWQFDLGRGLLKRELYGFCFRASLLKTQKVLLTFNTGAMYEHEIWKGTVLRFPMPVRPGYAETQFIKSTSYLNFRADLASNVRVLLVTYYQARYERFFRPRIISDLQVNITINKYFTISNQFTSTLDALLILANNIFVYAVNTSLLLKF